MTKSREIGVSDSFGDALRLVITKDAKGRLRVEVINLICLIAYPPIVGSVDRIEQKLASRIGTVPAQTVRKQIEHDLAQGLL